MDAWVLMLMLIVGMVSFVILIAITLFFGRLIKHQFKIWMLRNKGFIQVRHIRDDMNEDYYFIRFKNDHFDFSQGIYMYQRDTKSKTDSILTPVDPGLLSKKPADEMSAGEKELKRFIDAIKDSKIMDIKTLPWGIPTITYFGQNPNPINFRDVKKVYDAKNIAAVMKRLLMTKEWKLVRIALIVGCVASVGLLILGFADYKLVSDGQAELRTCQLMLNDSIVRYNVMFNNTIVPALHQNSTVNI